MIKVVLRYTQGKRFIFIPYSCGLIELKVNVDADDDE